MGARTKIEWTDSSWSPVTGCTKVSPGCENCYAERIAERFRGAPTYPNGFDVTLRPRTAGCSRQVDEAEDGVRVLDGRLVPSGSAG